MNAQSSIPSTYPTRFYKLVVSFERRSDGGLRAWSDDVPGFVLSHKDVGKVLADVQPALEFILSERCGVRMTTEPLDHLRLELEGEGVVDSRMPLQMMKEYVALQT